MIKKTYQILFCFDSITQSYILIDFDNIDIVINLITNF